MKFYPTIFPKLTLVVVCLVLLGNQSHADEWDLKGFIKYTFLYTDYPSDSLYNQLGYKDTTDQEMNIRLMAQNRWNHWDVNIHLQIIGLYGDSLELYRQLPDSPLFASFGIPSDQTRWFDLTHVIVDEGNKALLDRLDRFSIGYTTPSYVIRFGRDAVTWGYGLLYTPMDFFNPYAPTTVDKDYKTGDDMLYGQWLFDSGNDLQGVIVPRRDPVSGDLDSDLGSVAAKYHGFINGKEYDVLLARHFADGVLGSGIAMDWGESVVRGDVTLTHTEDKLVISAVANISYSWVWSDKNVTGFLEYFYSGFGMPNGNYDAQDVAENTELMERLLRGELFTLGRNYLAGSITVEATPLILLTPTLFVNLDDPSALLQFTGYYDWKPDLNILAGIAIPFGPEGTEFGGVPTDTPGVYLSTGISLYAKIAYFF